jgi:UDP-N-acetylmuramoyl-L-alanyl-D-glutamate--2,6-diaminopimelate ligase
MQRVDPADFDIGVVLNITRDHFEFHKTFEHYFAAKARLVRELRPDRKGGRPKAAVLNADEPLIAELGAGLDVPVITFGMERPADVSATEIRTGVAGSDFLLRLPGASPTPVHLPMPGRYNVANALAAAAVGWLAGVPLAGIAEGLAACRQVPGRSEVIDEGQPFTVIVDFAHNPDALAKVVSLRPEQPGARSILVFGAEGGKDQGKRPEMGAAARGADYAIVTSDNMPKEDPADVARQVESGLGDHPHEVVLDRREAIRRAISLARPGDVVIIAGKGHEQTWVFGGQRIPFDDRTVVRETLRTRVGNDV